MKKLFSLFLSLALVAAMLSACGAKPVETPPIESSASSGASVIEDVPAPPEPVHEESASAVSEASAGESSEEPSSAASVSSQASSAPAAKNAFVLDPGTLWSMYLFHPEQLTYALTDEFISALTLDGQKFPIIEAINELPLLEVFAGTPAATTVGFLFFDIDGKKLQYNLSPGCLTVDGTAYALTQQQYDALYAQSRLAAQSESPYAQWAIYMNPARVTAVDYSADLTGSDFMAIPANNHPLVASEMKYISVSGGKTYTPGSVDFSKLKSGVKTLITFDNGVVYTFVLTPTEMFLESSDMRYACRYKVTDQVASYLAYLQEAQTGLMNPRTGKPVIYLYPEKTRNVSVKLDFKGELCYTYPAYNNGWNVTAQPDGTLTNRADDSTHYYLFWDGNADFNNWDFSSGFVVKGSETQAFLLDKLPKLGLTPREYNDFITYWTPILARNPYTLITFSTTQYEAVAPLAITPRPDTVLRVHMVYKAITAPVDIPAQTLPTPPARNGFTVVEWGATHAR